MEQSIDRPLSIDDRDIAVLDTATVLTLNERRLIWIVLWVEIVSNVGNGLTSIVSPQTSITPLGDVAITGVGSEVCRWFGSLQLVIAIALYRSLHQPQALRCLLEALCIGDFIYCASFAHFASKYGQLPGVVAPFALTAVMFVARVRLWYCEHWAAAIASRQRQYSVLTG